MTEEQIKQWKESKRKLRLRLMQQIHEIRNPWKNVMTDEPKKNQDVFAYVPNLCGGEYCKLTYLGNYRWSQDEGVYTTEFYNNEVMWMPIPKLKEE